jgi:hypothetical protein
MDEDACWRWAFKKAYGRRPRGEELTRYQYWHGISRRDGFDASGPWECWPARAIPPDAESVDAPPEPVVSITNNVDSAPVPPETIGSSAVSPGETASMVPAANGTDSTHHDQPPLKSPGRKRRGRPPRVRQARALLQEQLADGPKRGELVEAAAAAAEIPERALIRATDALGVRTQRGQWWCREAPPFLVW